MEKDVIVLIIVVVLAIFAFISTLMCAYKKDRHSIYVHTKTGNRYRIIEECKMKYEGKWMDAVAYMSEKDGELYIREYDDFVLNFKRLSEWKKD